MRRGTTPTLTFTTPYEAEIIEGGFITFSQRGTIVADIPLSDENVTVADNSISVSLTQAQTLAFDASVNPAIALAQIRLLMTTGKATASNVVEIPVCMILKDGEIS